MGYQKEYYRYFPGISMSLAGRGSTGKFWALGGAGLSFTKRGLGTELRSRGLVASTFTRCVILPKDLRNGDQNLAHLVLVIT